MSRIFENRRAVFVKLHRLKGKMMEREEKKNSDLPEGWKIAKVGDVILKAEQINPLKLSVEEFEYIDVSSISRELLTIVESTSTLKANAPGRARKLVKTGDVIIATVRPTLKRLAFIEKEYDNQICSTAFCVLRGNPDLIADRFLFYAVQQPYIYGTLETMQTGASYPAVTDKNIHSILIHLPPKDEQKKIASILYNIDQKTELAERKKQTLNNLFQSMLNKLMTGEICVKDIS